MTLIDLQNLVFPKYQEFVEWNGHCPNTIMVHWELSQSICDMLDDCKPVFAGMQVLVDPDSLGPKHLKLGVLL